MFGRATHDRHQLLILERLLYVVEGAVVNCTDGRLETGLGRHKDDHRFRVMCSNRRENVEAGHIRHSYVGEYQLRLQGRDLLETLFPAEGSVRSEPFALEQYSNRVEDAHLVIDDENGRRRGRTRRHESTFVDNLGVRFGLRFAPSVPSFGKITVNRVPPRWSGLSTRIKPWCASTARCTIDRPSPLPPDFVVTNGSKSLSLMDSGIPRPWSAIRSITAPR